ncbi:MAG: NHL repeat-containing protein [Candidatus Binataceae bacterium]
MISSGQSTGSFAGRKRLGRATTASLGVIMVVLAIAVAGCGGSSSNSGKSHHFSFSTSGGLWVANGTNVLEFGDTFNSRTPNIAPLVTITYASTGFTATQGVLFDTAGDLWVIDGGNLATTSTGGVVPSLTEFTAADIASGGSLDLTPSVKITNTHTGSYEPLKFPQQAVFDSAGNLWMTDNSADDVNVFSASQLVTGGDIEPNAQFNTTGANGLNGPLGLAFDSSGNLWVANNGDTSIFEYDAVDVAEVRAGGLHNDLAPTIVLNNTNSSIEGPWALVFSSIGSLWSSNSNTPFTVVAFLPADLLASGTPTPATTFDPVTIKKVPSLNSPNGLAFDALEDLAAANSAAPFSIAIYEASQLGTSGPVKPEVLISGSKTGLVAPAGDVFGPLTP